MKRDAIVSWVDAIEPRVGSIGLLARGIEADAVSVA